MSKISKVSQLENEESLYRVSGVYDKSKVCYIEKSNNNGFLYVVVPVLGGSTTIVSATHLQRDLDKGTTKIMCIQRGA